jgi:hypothetical protein
MGRDNINITKETPLAEIHIIHKDDVIVVEEEFTDKPSSCRVELHSSKRRSDITHKAIIHRLNKRNDTTNEQKVCEYDISIIIQTLTLQHLMKN